MHTMGDAKRMNSLVREIFNRDGCHVPIAIFFRGGNNAVLPVHQYLKMPDGGEVLRNAIRFFVEAFEISSVVLVMESWISRIDRSKLVASGGGVEPEIRQEALTVSIESDDGLTVLFINPIVRDKNNRPTLSDMEVMNKIKGRLSGFFPCVPVEVE